VKDIWQLQQVVLVKNNKETTAKGHYSKAAQGKPERERERDVSNVTINSNCKKGS